MSLRSLPSSREGRDDGAAAEMAQGRPQAAEFNHSVQAVDSLQFFAEYYSYPC